MVTFYPFLPKREGVEKEKVFTPAAWDVFLLGTMGVNYVVSLSKIHHFQIAFRLYKWYILTTESTDHYYTH